MQHLPVIRRGEAYRSVDRKTLHHIKSGEPVVEVSQANGGLISRDLLQAPDNRRRLQQVPVRELLEICKRAGKLFAEGDVTLDTESGQKQSPEDYVRDLSATTGMPHALCRGNMGKIQFVLENMETVLGGLSRGLDLDVFDTGWAEQDGRSVSYLLEADTLAVVLPSNSPGVHSLWLPSIPLKVPLALKPGRQEPWTPIRVIRAMIEAGCPAEAFGFYPTDHGGAGTMMTRGDRSMIFGDVNSVRPYANDHRIQIHGPGWSKVLVGEDQIDNWQEWLEIARLSIAENGGRSCLNASALVVPRHGREIGEALAEQLAKIEARSLDDPECGVAAFSEPRIAHAINAMIERELAAGGAEDLTAKYRGGERVVEVDGCTFLLPTLVWCDDSSHPLAQAEYLFPFAAIYEIPQDKMIGSICSTLVGTAITEDQRFMRELMGARNIDRLNLGPFPTSRVSWDQPHEGNLFEHLYRQRAFMSPGAGATASHVKSA